MKDNISKIDSVPLEELVQGQPVPASRSTCRYPFPTDFNVDVARAQSLISRFWKLNRTAVNPDTDVFAKALCDELGAEMMAVKSGETCLTWTIPEHWAVRKGELRTLSGELLVDFADNPLNLWTHSISYKGSISREDLIKNHVNTDPNRPGEVIYHYMNGYKAHVRDWGFSVPYHILEDMNDDEYYVEIDTDLDNKGELKIIDAFVEGELKETIFFMAHTCHPALVSDGIGCIATAAELYHALKAGPKPRYSYRFIFSPEYFGSAAYLEKADPEKVANLHSGIYLDMMTSYAPLGFQRSMQGNSRFDAIMRNVMTTHTPILIEKSFRKLWGNDETFYNGAGFKIPTLGAGRLMHREYHYDTDNLEHFSAYHLKESVWILQRAIEIFETDYIPLANFKGPVYLSKYGMSHLLSSDEPDWPANVERMQYLADGEYSCMDMADLLDIDFFLVRDFFDQLAGKGLIQKITREPKETDTGFICKSTFKAGDINPKS